MHLLRRGTAATARDRTEAAVVTQPYGGTWEPPYNAASALSIPVVGSSVGAMHPDVIDFGGSPFAGYRYWMAMTPYNGNNVTEIPSVVATNDITAGGTWEVPTGYTNPITANGGGGTHMADTDMIYNSATGRLHVFYVYTDNSTFQNIVSKWTNGDGTWSAETTVIAGADGTLGNPSIVKVGSSWRIYYTDDVADIDGLYYRESSTAPDSGYGSATTCACSLDFGAYERKAQNINIVKDTDGAIVCIISDSQADTLSGTMMFANAADGINFTITGPPVLDRGPAGGWDSAGIYRASVLVDTSGVIVESGANVHLWYSAYGPTIASWGTGYKAIPTAFLRL